MHITHFIFCIYNFPYIRPFFYTFLMSVFIICGPFSKCSNVYFFLKYYLLHDLPIFKVYDLCIVESAHPQMSIK